MYALIKASESNWRTTISCTKSVNGNCTKKSNTLLFKKTKKKGTRQIILDPIRWKKGPLPGIFQSYIHIPGLRRCWIQDPGGPSLYSWPHLFQFFHRDSNLLSKDRRPQRHRLEYGSGVYHKPRGGCFSSGYRGDAMDDRLPDSFCGRGLYEPDFIDRSTADWYSKMMIPGIIYGIWC